MTPTKALEQQLFAAITETGVNLQKSAAEVAAYAAERALHLSTIVGQLGYDEAVIAERDAVALFAGVSAAVTADAADNRIVGLIQAGIAMLAAGAANAG